MIRHLIAASVSGRAWVNAARELFGTLSATGLPTGVIVARTVATPYTTNADLSTAIPADDTVPMDSEGTQILTVAHAMQAPTNRLVIRFQGWGSGGDASQLAAALISSTATLAIAAHGVKSQASDNPILFGLTHEYSSGATTSVTYSIRVGPQTAGAAMRMNGITSTRRFGGVSAFTLVIEEVKA